MIKNSKIFEIKSLSSCQHRECFKIILKVLNDFAPNEKFEIKLKSRLVWRNVVYRAISCNKNIDLCIKIFLNEYLSNLRFMSELQFENHKDIKIDSPPIIYYVKQPSEYIKGVIIRPWINSPSAMDELISNPNMFLENKFPIISTNFKKLWNADLNSTFCNNIKIIRPIHINANDMFNDRLPLRFDEAFLLCKHQRPKLAKQIEYLQKKYEGFKYDSPKLLKLINGDPSMHELFLKENRVYWIDWENIMINDPMIDVAGIYYSMANNFYNNLKLQNLIFNNIIEAFEVEKFDVLGFYFTERVITSELVTQGSSCDEHFIWGIEKAIELINFSKTR